MTVKPDSSSKDISFITKHGDLDQDAWLLFVQGHPFGNVFHTPQMVSVYERTRFCEPVVVAALKGTRIVGLIVAVIQREGRGPVGLLTARAVVWGGPLVEAGFDSVNDRLLCAFDQILKKKVIYGQVRNLRTMDAERQRFEERGFEYEEHFTIHVDLRANVQERWRNLSGNARRQIRRSEKECLVVRSVTKWEDVQEGETIIRRLYSRIGLPLPDHTFFKAVYDVLHPVGMVRYFGVYSEDELVGILHLLCFKQVLYESYHASKDEHLKKCPNDALLWNTIKWGHNESYSRLDMGGAGKPGEEYGVRKFKLKFGGALVEVGRFQKTYNVPLYRLGEAGLTYSKKLRMYLSKVKTPY